MANKVVIFLKEVRAELGKVSWPTKDELISSASVVITSMLLLGLFIWVCDIVFIKLVNVVMKI